VTASHYSRLPRWRKQTAVIGKDKVAYILIPGAGHGGPQYAKPDNLRQVVAFLDKYLK
jgi:hypothetical protein